MVGIWLFTAPGTSFLAWVPLWDPAPPFSRVWVRSWCQFPTNLDKLSRQTRKAKNRPPRRGLATRVAPYDPQRALRRGRGHCQPPAARYAPIAVAVATGIIPWLPACTGIAVASGIAVVARTGIAVAVAAGIPWLLACTGIAVPPYAPPAVILSTFTPCGDISRKCMLPMANSLLRRGWSPAL